LLDADELALGTDPFDADSDDDSFSDGTEVSIGTNPLDAGLYPGGDLAAQRRALPGMRTTSPASARVPHAYAISATEITNRQYVAFLNAVARTADPAGLFSVSSDPAYGITAHRKPRQPPVLHGSWPRGAPE
jgi:formylglycine-generating enzyme required for sulfatase activity